MEKHIEENRKVFLKMEQVLLRDFENGAENEKYIERFVKGF